MEIKKYPVLKWLFQQYQEDKLDRQKKELVDDWFDDYHKAGQADILSDPATEDRIHQELSRRVSEGIQPKPIAMMWPHSMWLKAACVLLIAGIGTVYFYKPQSKSVPDVIAYQTISTPNKQVKKIVLADGTEIWLNCATHIRISQSFGTEKNRIVYLDKGEAFFKVKHNASRPFSVISGNVITRDIGTSFNIRAYDLKNEYRVAVASGKVDVMQRDSAGELQAISAGIIPGRALTYNSLTNTAQITYQDTALVGEWKTGDKFRMEEMTLPQIAGEIARKFDLKITVQHPQYDPARYSINSSNQNIRNILQQLTFKTGMSYRLQGDSLTINPLNKRMR